MTDFFNDDLSDLIANGQPSGQPKQLPQAPEFQRIRAEVPVFSESCPKCRGTGRFTSYAGRQLGPCFACKGKGHNTFKTSPEQRAAARQRTVDAKVEARQQNAAEIQWLTNKLATDRYMKPDFAKMLQDFLSKLSNGQMLSDRQMGVIERGMARDVVKVAQRNERAIASSTEIDVSRIEAAFERAREAGKIKIGLHYAGVFFGPKKGDPNIIYVKASKDYEATYYGKITGGRFFPSRDCTPEITAKIVLIASDPAAAAVADGKETGICCCCGLTLTNELSIELGIGPICRGKWGF